MVKMKAKKRFLFNGSILEIGEEFSVSEDVVTQYAINDLAVPVEEAKEQGGLHDYEKMTVSQLKEVAERYNVEGYHSMKKAELIDAIKAKEGEHLNG